MFVKDATPREIRDHLANCPNTCMTDEVMLYRLDLLNKQTDPCERRFLAAQVDERVGNLHGGVI